MNHTEHNHERFLPKVTIVSLDFYIAKSALSCPDRAFARGLTETGQVWAIKPDLHQQADADYARHAVKQAVYTFLTCRQGAEGSTGNSPRQLPVGLSRAFAFPDAFLDMHRGAAKVIRVFGHTDTGQTACDLFDGLTERRDRINWGWNPRQQSE